MKHLKLFEEYSDVDLYEEIGIQAYIDYMQSESSLGGYIELTQSDMDKICAPDDTKVDFGGNFESGLQKNIAILIQYTRKRKRRLFIINKFQDDWFIVRHQDMTSANNRYYKCDAIEGVNKLIKDKIECDI